MICKFCGFNNEDTAKKCVFCGKDLIDKEETKEGRDKQGYVRLDVSAIFLIALALGFYFGLSILFSIIGTPLITAYDFSCLKEGASCSLEQVAAQKALYEKITTILQVVLELLIVVVAIIIFRKKLKYFFAEFKEKKTYAYAGMGLGLVYGGSFIYGIILNLLELSTSGSENQAAVESSIISMPLMGFIFVVVAAPLFEEIVFRLCLFRAFTHKSKKIEIIGLVLTITFFAMIHMGSTVSSVLEMAKNGEDYSELLKNDLLSLPSYLIGAFGITYTYYKSKNFASSVLVHMANNAISFVVILISSIAPIEDISSAISEVLRLLIG